MTQKISTANFRSVFKVMDKEALHWFPGHMGKGLKQMQNKLKSVDCIIEVHDSRVPISGRNIEFKHTLGGIKPHILVLNKVDLIQKKYMDKVRCKLKDECENILFTNCKDEKCKGLSELLPLAQHLIVNSDRFNRSGVEDFNVMIIGIPNVGKSSLVNALRAKYLRKGHASPVGAVPGITRSVLTKIKISEDPLFYMLDTPGILAPNVQDVEAGLKLSLCATLQDHLVGETVIADYLLYHLNKYGHFKYVKYFKLDEPSDDILVVLTEICKKQKKQIRMKNSNNEYIMRPDFHLGAKIMLKAFRNGELGHIVLDEDFL
ncbi:mitochondrial GTPase 1 [Coccinella septempunctata]|uniref:mitochondrial GTPase 1 n=1 Tax=Coccinella septempunctata TaxID=41139 RepID=UPI001D067B28|nr:mitochondrial GTPase 1 [Coccinella septempunctata]